MSFKFYAGIDGVAPVISKSGKRMDQQELSQFKRFYKTDLFNTRMLDMDIVRVGANWYEVEPVQGVYNFTFTDELYNYAKSIGVKIWYVVQHKQVPEWTNLDHPDFPKHLASYALTLAKRYDYDTFFPSIEPVFYASMAGKHGSWSPFRTDAYQLMLNNLTEAILLTAETLKNYDPAIKIIHNDFSPGYEMLDKIASSGFVDYLGLDYYPVHGLSLKEYIAGWSKYKLPLLIGEIGIGGSHCRHNWKSQLKFLRESLESVKESILTGIDVIGFCPYPTCIDNLYWGENQLKEYSSFYPPADDICFFPPGTEANSYYGDNAGAFFRFKYKDGTLQREPNLPYIQEFKSLMYEFLFWYDAVNMRKASYL